MGQFEEYKQQLLTYLYTEQSLDKRDIEEKKHMSREEKILSDILIPDLTIAESDETTYILNLTNNNSKLRSGDKVVLKAEGAESGNAALVVDVNTETITISTSKDLSKDTVYDMEIESPNLLNSLIDCLEGILPATPGASFLRMLSGEEKLYIDDFLSLIPEEISGFDGFFSILNEPQKAAIRSMLKFYPVHILQGPPGTGKTQVLAATAIATSLMNREVVVIANTHQAVNNALMKIRQLNKNIPLFKIGELLKAEELSDDLHKFQKFSEYNDYSRENRRKKKYGYVLGMTIWGAITNLGLRTHSHFRPYMALVDEASLMPLTYASILGKCSSSICLFGDSRQMPPIIRPELKKNIFSESILDYCAKKIKGIPIRVLPETHRMNEEITNIVSHSFYESYGIKLHSAKEVSDKKFFSCYLNQIGMTEAISYMSPSISTPNQQEENEGEANAIAGLLKELYDEGHQPNEFAVITPFRKQVRLLRSKANELFSKDRVPLIDTVERLQGQDVECIILSFATSDEGYILQMNDFLFNCNRLNVMISRAKTKVIIFASVEIQKKLKHILIK